MLLQAALNGPFGKADHEAVTVSPEELTRDAALCAAAGAGAIHMHPRDSEGRESLDAAVVDEVARAVRKACGVPVGVSTGAWIEPDVRRRVKLIREWTEPGYASVNLSEEGAGDVIAALIEAGIGIEAGVWSVEDAESLAAADVSHGLTRILVEPVNLTADNAVEAVDEIHRALDATQLEAPRLEHGDGEATWVLISDAVRRGIDTRVGLEDTQHLPNGELATGNAALIRAALALGAGE